jgi:hypothetical protein
MLQAISSKQKVRALAVLSAATLAAAAATVGTTGTAHAAQTTPATAGQYCGTQATGNTGIYGKSVGTEWVKQPPGCRDLNVVYTSDPAPGHWDEYNGNLWNGTGWYHCKSGFRVLYDGPHDPDTNTRAVLCTDVGPGTIMAIDTIRDVASVEIND